MAKTTKKNKQNKLKTNNKKNTNNLINISKKDNLELLIYNPNTLSKILNDNNLYNDILYILKNNDKELSISVDIYSGKFIIKYYKNKKLTINKSISINDFIKLIG